MNPVIEETVERLWRTDALEALSEFIKLPAKSVGFDPCWEQNGFLLKACEDAARWGKKLFPDGIFEVLRQPGRSPALFFEIPATSSETTSSVFFYGHFDKQPEGSGWSNGRSAFEPSLEGERLYGRGAADDGYNFYAALTALAALDRSGTPRARAVGLYETAEECESVDFEHWMKIAAPRLGRVGLVVVMDGTCCDYDRLWNSTSFHGAAAHTLTVRVLEHRVHSGVASGIVPDSFAIARSLLERIECSQTGEMPAPELNTEIPSERIEQMRRCAAILGQAIFADFPWSGTTHAKTNDPFEALVLRGWKPQLCVIGASGLPALQDAGNVLRSETSLRLSVRLPPGVDEKKALDGLASELTRDPPFGCTVTISDAGYGPGWNAPAQKSWFAQAFDAASLECFGNLGACSCEGASIPILSLMESFFGQQAQYLVTGVLGPHSNAHGPDEMLNLAYLKKLTCAVAGIIAAMQE